jgi:hypothetical protein
MNAEIETDHPVLNSWWKFMIIMCSIWIVDHRLRIVCLQLRGVATITYFCEEYFTNTWRFQALTSLNII